ncbi:MAG: VCBS repeat-containing protein [Deltaproteobacteria bacterium]|nr:VCBS repeat-containing protein [Deltaproteobacteria bacterium]
MVCVGGQCSAFRIDSGVVEDTGVADALPAPDAAAPDASAPDAVSVDSGIAADTGATDSGSNDRDGDGVPDIEDNCPDTPNTDQRDSDLDGQGDACDPPTTTRTGGPSDPTCTFTPPPRVFEPAVEWHWEPGATTPSPEKHQVMSTPVVVHLSDDNSDGRVDALDVPDVVFISFDTTGPVDQPYQHILNAGIVRAVSGDDGRELWSATGAANQVAPASNLAAGDLDGDGVPEIVAERWTGGVIAFRADGSLYWDCNTAACRPVTAPWGALAIADLDGQGPEVIRGACVLEGRTGVVRFCGTGGQGSNGVGGISVAADLDGDDQPEVVAGRSAYRANGTPLWEYPQRNDGFVAVGQLDADAAPELVMVGNGLLYRLDSDGAELWNVPIRGGGFGGPPTIANFDQDAEPEIGVAGRTRYTVYDLNGAMVWSNEIQELSSSRTGSSVFDFDGDGKAEIVYNDENTLFVYSYVGTASAAVVWSAPNSTLTAHEYPVIADVDNDGNAEIIVGANDFGRPAGLQRGLFLYGDVRDNWVPTRPIWNQHSYHITNVTAAAGIPYPEPRGWALFNTYRCNEQGTGSSGALAAPDLLATSPLAIKRCARYIDIGAWIENRGAIQLAAGLQVAFYDGTPSPTNPAFAIAATNGALQPGSAELVTVRWMTPPPSPRTVTVIADDDGTGNGSGAHNECNEGAQNSAQLAGQGCP